MTPSLCADTRHFPKGVCVSRANVNFTVEDVDYPIWQVDALVVGSAQQDYVRQLNLNAASKMC